MSSDVDSPILNSKAASTRGTGYDELLQETSQDRSTASTYDSSRPEVLSPGVDVSPKQEGEGEIDSSVFTMGSSYSIENHLHVKRCSYKKQKYVTSQPLVMKSTKMRLWPFQQ